MALGARILRWFGQAPGDARALDDWRAGLALQQSGDDAGAREWFGRALHRSPQNAKWQNEFGLLCMTLGDTGAAQAAFDAALGIDPRFAEAHCNLGMLLAGREDGAAALRHFQRAAELKPDLAPAQYNCGLLLHRLGRVADAASHFERAAALLPDSADAWRHSGFALQELGRVDQARASLERSLELDPGMHEARLSLGLLRLLRGDFRQGWTDYRARCATAESPLRAFPVPDWDGGPLAARTLLVYAEQGVGDEILFASCLPDLIAQAKQVVVDCEPRLAKLFARSFPRAAVHGGRRDEDYSWLDRYPRADCKIAAGSVPGFLRNSLVEFPSSDRYLAADPARVAFWKQRLDAACPGAAMRVGVVWRAGLKQTGGDSRSVRAAELARALQLPALRLVSLQHDASAQELDAAASAHGLPVLHWPDAHGDFDETAALVCALDLVVAVCSTAVHLAGALGKPTWVLTPSVPDWRYLAEGEHMPWHPSVRLLRQAARGDWTTVLSRLREVAAAWPQMEGAVSAGGANMGVAAAFTLRGPEPLPTMTADKPEEKRQALERRIDDDPGDAGAYRELAELALASGELEDAVDNFELALHYQPRDVDALVGLARALRAGGDAAGAEQKCRQAMAHDAASLAARMEFAAALKAQDRRPEAIAVYRDALALQPGQPQVLCNLGLALHEAGDYAAAEPTLRQALAHNPQFAEAHLGLGLVLRERGNLEGALAEFRAALKQGGPIASRSALAHALRDLGRIGEALAEYDAVLETQPGLGDAVLNHSYALLMRGDDKRDDYARGWDAHERRFAAGGFAPREFGLPTWNGGPTAGKAVLVFGEQGLGDEIMFASCIPDLLAREPRCVIECNRRLGALFARSFAVPVHGGAKTDATGWIRDYPELGWQIPVGSLPRLFRRHAADFPRQRAPYLRADAGRTAEWGRLFAGLDQGVKTGAKVGLSWRGGNTLTRGALRSLELAHFATLSVADAHFVSLQHGETEAEIVRCREAQGLALAAWPRTGEDLDDLAAMIAALDLVITIDNTVAHLAGALGKPVWILLARGAEWRYGLDAGRMPWYPQARLFRQQDANGWSPVLARVAEALQSWQREPGA